MGMYNEVSKRCPNCVNYARITIPQVVLGFGGFDLDSPGRSIKELTQEEKKELAGHVNSRYFYCEPCDRRFKVKVVVNQEEGGEEVMI
jgi:hypothetical protein